MQRPISATTLEKTLRRETRQRSFFLSLSRNNVSRVSKMKKTGTATSDNNFVTFGLRRALLRYLPYNSGASDKEMTIEEFSW